MKTKAMKFDKYKVNLGLRNGVEVYSYDTHVATIDHKRGTLHQLGWWSVTTQKHINYVAKELNLELIDNRRIQNLEKDKISYLELLRMISNRDL